jgi:hypothetical protein
MNINSLSYKLDSGTYWTFNFYIRVLFKKKFWIEYIIKYKIQHEKKFILEIVEVMLR